MRLRSPNSSPDIYQISSPSTPDYNCIAWGAEEDDRWWDPTDPDQYWPDGVSRELTLETFVQAYQTLGYLPDNSVEFEPGFQKIAIYTKPDGEPDGQPTHVAIMLSNGRWTSKLGSLEDIEHDLEGLRGFYYGACLLLAADPCSNSEAHPGSFSERVNRRTI